MAIAIDDAESCAATWLKAMKSVDACAGHETENVLLSIPKPMRRDASDLEVERTVDQFLRRYGGWPLSTVANTIFPRSLYRAYGAPEFYTVYLNEVYRRVADHTQWGRYFERMVHRVDRNGREFNPLQSTIDRLNRHVHGQGSAFRHLYEVAISDPALDLPVYDAERDQNRTRNRQCMSFLSFHLNPDKSLRLTAVYRNHYYVQRLLGNMIGLTNLLAFVGEQARLEIGGLTILSANAEIDSGGGGWRRQDIRGLIERCEGQFA